MIQRIFEKSIAILLPVLIVAFFLSTLKYPVNTYDEGIEVYNASRILNGDLPYRDFWSLYAPGQFYAIAAVFKLFGPSILAARLYDLVIRLILVLLVYLITRRLASPVAGIIASLLTSLWLGVAQQFTYPVFVAIMLALTVVYLFMRYLDNPRPLLLNTIGTIIGVLTLFRHDMGAYVFICFVSVLTLQTLFDSRKNTVRQAVCRLIQAMAHVVLGLGIIVLPVTLFFVSHVPVEELWSDLIRFPGTTLLEMRSLPLPSPFPSNATEILYSWLPVYGPLIVYASTLVVICLLGYRSRLDIVKNLHWPLLLLTCLGTALFVQVISRADPIHLLPTSIIAVITLTSLISCLIQRTALPSILKWATALGCVVAIYPFHIEQRFQLYAQYLSNSHLFGCPALVERASCTYIAPDQQQAIIYVQAHTDIDDHIFVGNIRHDRIFINDNVFYFLANRQSSIKYHELYPGLATTQRIQQQLVDEIIWNDTKYIVLTSRFDRMTEPNGSSRSSGVTYLDRFIRAYYEEVAEFGSYVVLKRL